MIKIDDIYLSDEKFRRDWDGFVLENSFATFYHLYGWKNVLFKTFGLRPIYTAHYNSGGRVDGILPLFLMRDILGKRYLVSNPFANFAGICAESKRVAETLLQKASQLAQKYNAQYVELRQLESPVDENLPAKNSFVTLYLELPKSSEAAWKNLTSRNRGKIRKAERSGVQALMGKKYIEDFFCVYAENISRLGSPIFPLKFFKNLMNEFPEETEILVLHLNCRPVAGMFLFEFKSIIAEPWVSTLRAVGKIYANNYLYWKAIEYATNRGFEYFDFGRSTVDTGTYHFKLLWGAVPIQLYYQYILYRAKFIPKFDARENRYQRAIELWKKIPTRASVYFGPQLVRFLPEL